MVTRFPEGSPPVVLVIEDEDDAETCRLVRSALAPDVAVTAVGGSPPAIARGAALLPDLVVAGPACVLRIRMDPGLRDVPLLLVTGPADADVRAELLRRAAQDYVLRPFSPAEIRVRALNLMVTKRARDLLCRDLGLDPEPHDLEALARASSLRHRELSAALEAARCALDCEGRRSRTKTAYLRTVGHELSTPLATLREGLEQLHDAFAPAACPAAAGHAATLRAIDSSLEWIAELARSILDHASGDRERG